MNQRYIIDANVFIQGKNFHYDFGFCTGYEVLRLHAHGTFEFSP